MEIKVLGLYDRASGISYHTESINWSGNTEFIRYLAAPHSEKYIVKYINLADMIEIENELAFNVIAHQKDGEIHQASFDRLWKLSKPYV